MGGMLVACLILAATLCSCIATEHGGETADGHPRLRRMPHAMQLLQRGLIIEQHRYVTLYRAMGVASAKNNGLGHTGWWQDELC